MITVNKQDFSIEVKEFLTFDSDVLKVYNDLKDIFVEGDDEDTEIYNFLHHIELNKYIHYHKEHHQLTDEDKIEILNNIKDEYDDGYEYDSIFDDELIKKVLINWIDEKFGVLI